MEIFLVPAVTSSLLLLLPMTMISAMALIMHLPLEIRPLCLICHG